VNLHEKQVYLFAHVLKRNQDCMLLLLLLVEQQSLSSVNSEEINERIIIVYLGMTKKKRNAWLSKNASHANCAPRKN
jgi:hypothetical protein